MTIILFSIEVIYIKIKDIKGKGWFFVSEYERFTYDEIEKFKKFLSNEINQVQDKQIKLSL